jgi:hypothetical protein
LKQKFIGDGDTQYAMNEIKSLITLAYGLSGKQISEREMKLLQDAILPSLNQPYTNFRATLKFAKDWVASTHDTRLKGYRDSGFETKIKPLAYDNEFVQAKEALKNGAPKDEVKKRFKERTGMDLPE